MHQSSIGPRAEDFDICTTWRANDSRRAAKLASAHLGTTCARCNLIDERSVFFF